MKKATVRQLVCEFDKLEYFLQRGKEIQITKRGRVIARLVPGDKRLSPKLRRAGSRG